MGIASQSDKAARFEALHRGPAAFVIANPWDAGSARVLAGLGFVALATSSGASAAVYGRRDGRVSREEAMAHVRAILEATDLPVSADLENGFGDAPADAAETIRQGAAAVGQGMAAAGLGVAAQQHRILGGGESQRGGESGPQPQPVEDFQQRRRIETARAGIHPHGDRQVAIAQQRLQHRQRRVVHRLEGEVFQHIEDGGAPRT